MTPRLPLISPADHFVAYKEVPAPKYKKDYADKLVQVQKVIPRYGYRESAKKIIPDGAVFTLSRRETNVHTYYSGFSEKDVALKCHWPCPVCGHRHERIFKEAEIESGNIRFVEPDPGAVAANLHDTLYLACPYSHPEKQVRQERWLAVSRAAAWLMTHGTGPYLNPVVLSPISMGHPISVTGALDTGFDAWQNSCLRMLSYSDALIILALDGYLQSTGCMVEFGFATAEGIPAYLMTPAEGGYTLTPAPEIPFEV